MRSIPVDVARCAFLALSVARAETRDPQTGAMVPKADRNGQPQWKVQVAAKLLDGVDDGDLDEVRAEPFDVTITGERPKVAALDAVEFDNLVARAWSMEGRSGVSFSATAVSKAGASSNGKRSSSSVPPVPSSPGSDA